MKLFIGAHLDDIEIGCGAYLSCLKKRGELDFINKRILILSEGRFNNPIDIRNKRKEAFKINMEKLGIKENEYKILSQRIDTEFHDYQHEIKHHLNKLLKEAQEDEIIEVYFHSADNHQDHQIVNKLVKEIFRPFLVNRLIEFEIPSSNLFNQPGDNFNYYLPFDKEIAEMKQELINSYKDISLFATKDARDINYTLTFNKLQGQKLNKDFCERYNIIYTDNF